MSIASHPVLVFYGVTCYLSAVGLVFPPFSSEAQGYNLSLVLVTTVILPVLIQYMVSQSLFMEERKDRLLPILGTAISYLFVWGLFHLLAIPAYLMAFMLSLIIGLFGIYIVTWFYKISVHTSATGSMLALFFSFINKKESYPLIQLPGGS